MNWRDYENAVFEILRSRFPTEAIEVNVMIPGRFSKIDRQVDVVGRQSLIGRPLLAIGDCKAYSRRVDVKDVEAVIGMAADLGANVALIITTVGYSEAASNRATNEPNVPVHLDIVTTDQAVNSNAAPAVALMYRGRIGAVVLAPSGWLTTSNIVNGNRVLDLDAHCYLHPNELTLETAMLRKHIGWCHIEDNPGGVPGRLEHFLEIHHANALKFDPNTEVKTWGESVGGSEILFRRIHYKTYDYVDFTFFVDVGGAGLFWACMTSPTNEEQNALARLRFIADSVWFALAPSANPSDSHEVWQRFFPWQKEVICNKENR